MKRTIFLLASFLLFAPTVQAETYRVTVKIRLADTAPRVESSHSTPIVAPKGLHDENVPPSRGGANQATHGAKLNEVQQKMKKLSDQKFGEDHWNSLKQIVMHESGFRPEAVNASSGACGLFQALPCSKMGGMELDHQIEWGLAYIARRYGNPNNAWDFWQVNHWY